jgi:hypothetical protein
VGRGAVLRRWSWRRWNGLTGSTTGGSWSRSDTYTQQSTRRCTTRVRRLQSWWLDSSNQVSGNPGAVQLRSNCPDYRGDRQLGRCWRGDAGRSRTDADVAAALECESPLTVGVCSMPVRGCTEWLPRAEGAPVLSEDASRLKPEYHPGPPASLLPRRSQGIPVGAL